MKNRQESSPILSLSGWKIFVPIIIGLGISAFLLIRAINTTQYVKVESGQGTHVWKDANLDGKVNTNDPKEFIAQNQGDYKIENFRSVFLSIDWSGKVLIGLVFALIFMAGRDFFYMLRIRLLTKKKLSWRQSFYVIMIWEFASALSPGIIGGAAVAMFILRKEGIPLGRSTAIVIITAFMDNVFYILMVPIIFLSINSTHLFPVNASYTQSAEVVFWSGLGIMILLSAILFAGIFLYPQMIKHLLGGLFSIPILRKWKDSALQTGKDVEIASQIFRKEKAPFWFKTFAATCGSWISRYLVINAILAAFLSVSFGQHILLLGKQLVLWLFLIISPTPGASGVAEFAFSELLTSFSSSAFLLAFLAVLWRLISYFPYLFIGSILVPRWLRKKN